jgi:hypothetical protein
MLLFQGALGDGKNDSWLRDGAPKCCAAFDFRAALKVALIGVSVNASVARPWCSYSLGVLDEPARERQQLLD